MKTAKRKIRQSGLKINKPLPYTIILFILLGLSSCTEDIWIIESPQHSKAYLALTWTEDEPEYIDVGTNAIPDVFYWNDYYHIRPGFYSLYYDGLYSDGYDYIEYAWEVDYEIYTNDRYYDDDNYFSIDLNPNGPFVYLDYKTATVNQNFKILENTETKITILKEEKEYSMKVSYKKVDRRNQQ